MTRLKLLVRKARRVPGRRLGWVVLSATLMGLVWAGIRLLSFYPVYRLTRKLLPKRRAVSHPAAIESICWAVSKTGRALFGAHDGCLYQAIAGELLLNWYGKPAALKIGVQRAGQQNILAHAWVECDGVIMIGGERDSVYSRFQPLPDLPGIIQEDRDEG